MNDMIVVHILKWFIPIAVYICCMGGHAIYEKKTNKEVKGFLIISIIISLSTIILFI